MPNLLNGKPITPVLIDTHTEPDKTFIDRSRALPWLGFEQAIEFFEQVRPEIARQTDHEVHVNWHLRADPQIADVYGNAGWAFDHYAEPLRHFEQAGDNIGIHVHPYRWASECQDWVEDYANLEWVNHCVQVAADAYEQAYQRKPPSFTIGGSWFCQETLNLLNRLGIKYDLTIVPEQCNRSFPTYLGRVVGDPPDYHNVPRLPYRPLASNFKVADPDRHDGPWIIPQSSGPRTFAGNSLQRWYWKIFKAKILDRQQLTCKLFLADHPRNFQATVYNLLENLNLPYLTLTIRSNRFTSGKSRQNMRDNLDHLFSQYRNRRFLFSTPDELMDCLQTA